MDTKYLISPEQLKKYSPTNVWGFKDCLIRITDYISYSYSQDKRTVFYLHCEWISIHEKELIKKELLNENWEVVEFELSMSCPEEYTEVYYHSYKLSMGGVIGKFSKHKDTYLKVSSPLLGM